MTALGAIRGTTTCLIKQDQTTTHTNKHSNKYSAPTPLPPKPSSNPNIEKVTRQMQHCCFTFLYLLIYKWYDWKRAHFRKPREGSTTLYRCYIFNMTSIGVKLQLKVKNMICLKFLAAGYKNSYLPNQLSKHSQIFTACTSLANLQLCYYGFPRIP